jgi:hypothetical protein
MKYHKNLVKKVYTLLRRNSMAAQLFGGATVLKVKRQTLDGILDNFSLRLEFSFKYEELLSFFL